MHLGNKEFFTAEHILKHKGDTSPILAEQVVHCLELVSELSSKGLDYMFKGGNSLLVILNKPRRFSIDIDIATDETKERIDEVLDAIIADSEVFTKYTKRQHLTKPWLPMTSFHLYYISKFTDPVETFIMLDVQLKMSGYPKTEMPVVCGDLYHTDVMVKVPTVSSLIGDKLLTLGPATLGIPLNKKKEAQRLKHVFDVSTLSREKLVKSEIKASIDYCMTQENELQRTNFTLEEAYIDTMDYLSSVSNYPKEPEAKNEGTYCDEVIRGRVPFAEHLIKKDYPWETLQANLARVAFCFSAVINDKYSDDEIMKILKITTEEAKVELEKIEIENWVVKNLAKKIPFAAYLWLLIEGITKYKLSK